MKQSDTQSAKKSRIPERLTKVDEALLITIYKYYLMSIEQVTRALYSPGTYHTVKNRLASLEKRGYLLSLQLPTVKGSSPKIYGINRAGLNFLKDRGFDILQRFHPSEQKEKKFLFLEHTLAVNDVLIACSLIGRSHPEISVFDLQHERFLKLEPERYPIGIFDEKGRLLREEQYTFVPDGFVEFHIDRGGNKTRACILFEVDRGTIEARQFKKKIRAYLTYLRSGRFTKKYKARSVTIAYPTTAGDDRVLKMQEWTRDELIKTNDSREFGNLFAFAALPGDFDTEWLLLGNNWVKPFQKKAERPFALLQPQPW